MTPLTLGVVAFILALLLFGFAFWTPIYAIPFVLIFLVAFGTLMFIRRRGTASRELREFRRSGRRGAPERETHFTDRDRETLYDHR